MKRNILATCFTLVCGIALLSAQTPQTGSEQAGSTQGKDKGKITVTGCLKAGTEANTFVLNNISTSGSATAGSTGSERNPTEMARADMSYILTADRDVKLSDHVGHRIEVTGMLDDKGKGHSSTSATSSSTSTSTQSSASDMSKQQRLKVSSVRMISQSCP
jgi:hypothetical protein